MSEYWLISAPGDKTCQQTFERMNSLTSTQNNLCTNYKFHIPDLKVGTLDQLVGLSDDLGKLDTYVETITRKVAAYFGEVLEDQRDKLHENLLANNSPGPPDEGSTRHHSDLEGKSSNLSNSRDTNTTTTTTTTCCSACQSGGSLNKMSSTDELEHDYDILSSSGCNCDECTIATTSAPSASATATTFVTDDGFSHSSSTTLNVLQQATTTSAISMNASTSAATAQTPDASSSCTTNSYYCSTPSPSMAGGGGGGGGGGNVVSRSISSRLNNNNICSINNNNNNNNRLLGFSFSSTGISFSSFSSHPTQHHSQAHHQQQHQQQQQHHPHHQQQQKHNSFLHHFHNQHQHHHQQHQQQQQQHPQQQQQHHHQHQPHQHKHQHQHHQIHNHQRHTVMQSDESDIGGKESGGGGGGEGVECGIGNSSSSFKNSISDLTETFDWWFSKPRRNSKKSRSSPVSSCCGSSSQGRSSPDTDTGEPPAFPLSPADLSSYITRFQWDMAKYPIKQSLRNIADIISKQIGQIDADLKTKSSAYNNLKGSLQNLEKKQTGSLLTRNLADLVKKEHFILDSEYLTTLLVIVPKIMANDWLANYEKITDMIVPRSSALITQDNDYCLFNVTLFKKVVEEFKLHAREKKFIVRDFVYNEEELAAGKNEMTKLITDKKKQFGPLVRWLKINFSEAFCALIHVKALRVFVESVLRYGLPVNFQAILIEPNKKSMKRLRDCLNQLYGHLDGTSGGNLGSGADNVDIPGLGFGQSEYYPYVYYKINIDMVETAKI